MKLLAFFYLLLPSLYLSQDIRFIYRYKFVIDTLKKDIITEEITVLDYNNQKQHSIFTGLKHIISDSTMSQDFKKGIMSFPDASMKIRYIVEKNSGNTVYFYTPNHMPNPVLKIKDERKMKWKISGEKQNILGYSAQKATTIFAGRQWTAWFTTELPISDGPYKFSGLPGLILKIYDKTNTHYFEILSVQKQKSNYYVLNDDTYKEAKEITLSAYENMHYNPLDLYRKKAFTGDIIFRSNEEKQQFLKNIDIQIEESKIHDNNPIEIDH
ncbi:GLPGLI family protein [Chryseobacterium ginsenosidimutans]|uniref:GLPGLI family protein n=1 Tax=Chryseobacterium ginsenosidimutans TaxID=687846 RepID=UPI0021678322|nr:GLPGLI family protein [Chryseobacterium ginsenosidimutans]MCS3868151.1 GLPGLI family protein [Chryseobacterium ginsenosidimutans]